MIRTPSNLEVLLHYYVCPLPHERLEAPAVKEGIDELLHHGMLVTKGTSYETTEKARAYLQHLLKVPFPVMTYTIPEYKP